MHIPKRPGLRRIGLLATVVAATIIITAGCSSTTTSNVKTSTKGYTEYPTILTTANKGKTVTFWGWDTLKFNKPIEDYVKQVAGVTVKGRVVPNADIQKKIKLAVQTHTLPDVFKAGTGDIPTLVQIGAVSDITDLVAKYRKYLPANGWKSVTYKGKVYGIPVNSPAGGMFYRQDILTKYGIDPASLDTWDKFVAAALKIHDASKGTVSLFGYQKSLSLGVIIALINLNHAQLIDKNNKVAINADSPEWQSTMATIKKLIAPGVGKELPEFTPPWYQAMKDGTLAAFPAGTWFAQTIQAQAPDTKVDWNFQPFPAIQEGGDRYVDYGSAIITVSSQAKDRAAAFELAKAWSIDPEGAVGIGLEKEGISVVTTAALDSSFVKGPQPYFANNQPYWKDATDAYNKITFSQPANTGYSQALTIFGTDLAAFQAGQSADAFLTKVASDMREQIKGLK